MEKEIIIDAKGAILGRLASFVAKKTLLGEEVIIVNCADCVIAGRPQSIIAKYDEKRRRGGAIQRGPFFPRETGRIVKRTIRGMLPYKQMRGRDALKRVMCFNDTPEKYADVKKIKAGKQKKIKTIRLNDLKGMI